MYYDKVVLVQVPRTAIDFCLGYNMEVIIQ